MINIYFPFIRFRDVSNPKEVYSVLEQNNDRIVEEVVQFKLCKNQTDFLVQQYLSSYAVAVLSVKLFQLEKSIIHRILFANFFPSFKFFTLVIEECTIS